MDSFDEKRLLSAVERIASALEDGNRMFAEWIATQMQWHEEAEALTAARYEEMKTQDQLRYEQARTQDQVRMELEQRIAACHERAVALQGGKLELDQAHYDQLRMLVNGEQQ